MLYPNPALPKLLRAIASGADAKASSQDIIFKAAADELDALRSIVRESWAFLFDDDGSPIAPEGLRQRVKDLGLSET